MLGIGTLSNTDNKAIFSRKFRWSFQGEDERGKIVFPLCFVKLNNRPPCTTIATADENGGKIRMLPGDVQVTVYYTMYDDGTIAKEEFEKGQAAMKLVRSATIQLWDGCGCEIEKWDLDCVETKLMGHEFIMGHKLVKHADGNVTRELTGPIHDDHFVPTWQVNYAGAYYECQCNYPKPIPTKYDRPGKGQVEFGGLGPLGKDIIFR